MNHGARYQGALCSQDESKQKVRSTLRLYNSTVKRLSGQWKQQDRGLPLSASRPGQLAVTEEEN